MAKEKVPAPHIPADAALVPYTDAEVATARELVDASRAASTRAKYGRDWDAFSRWCRDRGQPAIPADPALVAVCLGALSGRGLSPSTLNRIVAALGHVHRRAGKVPPHKVDGGMVVLDLLAGARRSWGRSPDRKHAADADVIRDMLQAIIGDDLRAVRDRAIVSFGMLSCMRRSELVALDVDDVERVSEGVRIRIRRSKTDQEGQGTTIAVPEGRRLRPVHHLETWLARAGVFSGPLFPRLGQCGVRVLSERMSDRAVAEIVKRRASAAGYDPARFAGHSLRAGFLTSAARAGASVWKMQQQSRHKSVDVLSSYVRDAQLFEDHASSKFG